MITPSVAYLSSGAGNASHELLSFDRALQNAGVHNLNLVRVTSVLPPMCDIYKEPPPRELLSPGSIAFTVYSRFTAEDKDTKNEFIAAAIAVAVPDSFEEVGMFFEHSGWGTAFEHERQAMLMAKMAMIDRGLPTRSIEIVSAELELRNMEFKYGTVVATAVLID